MDDAAETHLDLAQELTVADRTLRKKVGPIGDPDPKHDRSSDCPSDAPERSADHVPAGGSEHNSGVADQVPSPHFQPPPTNEELFRWLEQDRRLLAYEIHDGPIQQITAAQMRLDGLLQSECVSAERARSELEIVLKLVREAVGELRHVINGLRPPILEELGVVAAIQFLIDDQSKGGPAVGLRGSLGPERLDPLLEMTIFRIVQEGLCNVRRHSAAKRAEVRLCRSRRHVRIEIRDWGVGFDPASLHTSTRLGVRGISERAKMLGGQAWIESALGKGTRVRVELPAVVALQKTTQHLSSS